MKRDFDAIRKFLEQEESKPETLSYHDPAMRKARDNIVKGLGRQFGVINWAEFCTHCFYSAAVTATICGMIGFWAGANWVIYIGGIGSGFILVRIWRTLRKYWPFRLLIPK